MTEIQFNGETKQVSSSTISELLTEFCLSSKKIAVEINNSIVSKPNYETTKLTDGDKVEIVHFVGGG